MKQVIEYDLSLTDEMTVSQVYGIYCDVKKHGIELTDPEIKTKASALQMWKTLSNLRFSAKANEMKIKELREWASVIRSAFICIHRVNYSAHETMCAFWDWYEEKRKPSTNARRFWEKCDEEYRRYQVCHKTTLSQSAWCVLDDHLRLVNDEVQIQVERLEPVIANSFIHQKACGAVVGQIDDIELLAKASIPLLWSRVIHHSYLNFFEEYVNKCGIDFTYDFRYADLSGMSRNFFFMLKQIGVQLHNDKDGNKILNFFDVDNSSVIEAAWLKVMAVARDENFADKKAIQAINLNDEAKKKYEESIKRLKTSISQRR